MNEKLLSEFTKMGCTNRRDRAMALQVYNELTEVKKYWDVEYLYDKDVECLYITARKSRSSENMLFVPVSVSANFSFRSMQKYLGLCKNTEKKSVCMVICTADSSCVYYKIEDGLGEPPSTSPTKSRDVDRKKLDCTLCKNQKLLENAAMYNLPVTLPKETGTQKKEERGDCNH